MLNSHAQNSEFVKFSIHGRTHRDESGQFSDVAVHFVPSSLLNLAVVLPTLQWKNHEISGKNVCIVVGASDLIPRAVENSG